MPSTFNNFSAIIKSLENIKNTERCNNKTDAKNNLVKMFLTFAGQSF